MTLRALITAIVEQLVGPRIDYSRTYRARVIAQNTDGTLDVVPIETSKIPSLTKVPVYFGLPGVSAKVKTGARVVLGFAEGDPALPYATVWESASVTEVTLDAELVKIAGGARNVAREGDPVAVILTPAAVTAASTGNASLAGWILKGTDKVRAP